MNMRMLSISSLLLVVSFVSNSAILPEAEICAPITKQCLSQQDSEQLARFINKTNECEASNEFKELDATSKHLAQSFYNLKNALNNCEAQGNCKNSIELKESFDQLMQSGPVFDEACTKIDALLSSERALMLLLVKSINNNHYEAAFNASCYESMRDENKKLANELKQANNKIKKAERFKLSLEEQLKQQ